MTAADFPALDALPGERRTDLAPGLSVVPLKSPTLPPATRTNAWLLGQRDVVVVDPASPWDGPRQAFLDALDGRRVQAIFLTHHHVDHVSGAAWLAEQTGAPVLAHAETADRIELPVARLLDEGDVVQTDAGDWRCLHTPGHAPGHLCLWRAPLPGDDRGELVAGDMVAGEGTILLDPPEGHLQTYLDSLERLLGLGPSRLLPAHGPALPDGPARLQAYIAHRHARTAQVQAALAAAGDASSHDLASVVYPDLPAAFLPIAARQILVHLVWLRERGLVGVVGLDVGVDGAQVRPAAPVSDPRLRWRPSPPPPPGAPGHGDLAGR